MTYLGLVLLALFLRLPLLANPESLNSDHAVSALQSLHMLRGEFSWFLWGIGYQASLEPLINAVFFLIVGKNSYAVLATAFLAYALSLGAIHSILRKRLSREQTVLALAFLVIAAPPFLTNAFYPPRPWCLTFVFYSLLAFDRGRLIWGGALAFLALYIDFFAVQFLPALLAFGAFQVWVSHSRKQSGRDFTLGIVLGTFLLGLTRCLGPQGGPPLAINFHYLANNLRLLATGILPALFGVPTLSSEFEAIYPPWFRHPLLLFIRAVGGLTPIVLIFYSLKDWKKWNWDLRGWVAFALLLSATSLLGSILSSSLSDFHANRYLLPLVWALPFALLPTIKAFPLKKGLAIFTPYFLVLLLTLQLSYREGVRSLFIPTPTSFGTGAKEKELARFLLSQEIRHGYATYWPSYRITYLLRENLLVVPVDLKSNRYRPYWDEVEKAKRYALIFTESEGDYLRDNEANLKSEHKSYRPFRVAGFNGFLVER